MVLLLRVLKLFMCFSGLIALIIGSLTIILAISMNPWFSLERNALSDLGAIDILNNYVFNMGLMITSIFMLIYSIYLILILNNKIGIVGSSLLLLASIYLFLIGVFPEGTYPHEIISYEFFLLSAIAIMLMGISFLMISKIHGTLSIVLIVIGIVLAIIIPWPSIGALELMAIVIMGLWILVMLHHHIKYMILTKKR